MLAHFLRRDFRDFQTWWALLGVLTIGALVAEHLLSALVPTRVFTRLPTFMGLFWIYTIFEMVSIPHVLGGVWRTQHQTSRYYLLSLPLSHRKLFAIQHARLAVFWLPLIGLGGVGPWWAGAAQLP